MPRAKRVVEDTTETEAAPVARRGRRKAAVETADVEAAPVARRGRRKAAADTAEVEAAPVARRGRRKAAEAEAPEKVNGAGRAKQELLYVERNKVVWGELEDGRDSKVTLADDASPRGRVQNMVVDFMNERGRKKTTAEDVIAYLDDEEVNGGMNIVSHLINIGMLEVA